MVHQGIQQQRSDSVSAITFVHSQRQDVAHVIVPASGLIQDPLVLPIQRRIGLDLGDEQSDDLKIDGGCQGEESRAARNVLVPGQRILDGEPVLAQGAHVLQVVRDEETQLDVGRAGHFDGSGVQLRVVFRRLHFVIVLPVIRGTS